SVHDAAESNVVNNTRHATCADCHNGHASGQVASFPVPPMTRASQNGVMGVSATDMFSVIPQFAMASSSSHPVTHVRMSALPQPSLLANMLNLDGATQGRSMGVQI